MPTYEKSIGQKIKEIRQKKGITQKDLAGDKITRNMLSLIENGTASPSVSTLLYIAEKLGMPPGYFFSFNEKEEGLFLKTAMIDRLKQAFISEDFHECDRLCTELPSSAIDDELSQILAVSYLKIARHSADKLQLKQAYSFLNKSQFYANASIYCGTSFVKSIDYHKELFDMICTEDTSDILCNDEYGSEYVPSLDIKYFSSLKLLHNKDTALYKFPYNTPHHKHITALIALYNGNDIEAMNLLKELSESPALPFFMIYRVFCGLEYAADSVGDLKIAYNAARKKLNLIEQCKV